MIEWIHEHQIYVLIGALVISLIFVLRKMHRSHLQREKEFSRPQKGNPFNPQNRKPHQEAHANRGIYKAGKVLASLSNQKNSGSQKAGHFAGGFIFGAMVVLLLLAIWKIIEIVK